MKIFRISQEQNRDYDTYDSAVVYARSKARARTIHPGDYYSGDPWKNKYSPWCSSPDEVEVEYLGEAKKGAKEGIILASFNAG